MLVGGRQRGGDREWFEDAYLAVDADFEDRVVNERSVREDEALIELVAGPLAEGRAPVVG